MQRLPARRLRHASPADFDLMHSLRSKGLKATGPRLYVFHFLRDNGACVPSELANRSRTFNRASMYRTLKVFREQKVIQDIVIGGKRKVELTDRYTYHHHHMSCTRCGEVISFGSQKLEIVLQEVSRLKGYKETGHQIEITGLCPGCQRGVS